MASTGAPGFAAAGAQQPSQNRSWLHTVLNNPAPTVSAAPAQAPPTLALTSQQNQQAGGTQYFTDRDAERWYNSLYTDPTSPVKITHSHRWKDLSLMTPPQSPTDGYPQGISFVDVMIRPTNRPSNPYVVDELDNLDFLDPRSPSPSPTPQPSEMNADYDEETVVPPMTPAPVFYGGAQPMTWACNPGEGVGYSCCSCMWVTLEEEAVFGCGICGHLPCQFCTEL